MKPTKENAEKLWQGQKIKQRQPIRALLSGNNQQPFMP